MGLVSCLASWQSATHTRLGNPPNMPPRRLKIDQNLCLGALINLLENKSEALKGEWVGGGGQKRSVGVMLFVLPFRCKTRIVV